MNWNPKDLSLLSSYNVSQLKEGDYLFTTDSGIVYNVYMLDESLYFDAYPEFSADVHTLGFDMITNPLRKTPFDKRVRVTISNIIIDYLTSHPEKIFFFVCDSADARERSRMRIFELCIVNGKQMRLKNITKLFILQIWISIFQSLFTQKTV